MRFFQPGFGHPKSARKRGRVNEDRVLRAVELLVHTTRWIRAVRRATPEEDKSGVDLVVTTDHGEIGIQVKSSELGAKDFRKRQEERLGPKQRIALIVADPILKTPGLARVVERLLAEQAKRQERREGVST